jgi:hypothetical protein
MERRELGRKAMLVRKFCVYLRRKGERHYDYIGDREVSVSDDGRDAWFELEGTDVHGAVTSNKAFAVQLALRSGMIRDLYVRE